MIKRTDAATEKYYNNQIPVYQQVWDSEGRICWGYYDDAKGISNFKAAGIYHVERLWERGELTKDSVVLDLGCGLGINTFAIAKKYACQVVGLDISGEMIAWCENERKNNPQNKNVSDQTTFVKGTLDTEYALLKEFEFTHMFSSGTICQIHRAQRFKLWAQLADIMKPGAKLIFDDATCPNGSIQYNESKAAVYDRLTLDNLENAQDYMLRLESHGFDIIYQENLDRHMARSYSDLAESACAKGYKELGDDYMKSVKAIECGDFGWHVFVCRLVGSN